jgi:hypothetical protein
VHRVTYVIQTRNVKPGCRAGALRVFSESDMQHIAAELRRIGEERGN